MTSPLIEAIKKDRLAGSKTAWHLQATDGYDGRSTVRFYRVFDEDLNAICDEEYAAYNDGGAANMRRIARVPDLEAALIAAEELADAIAMSKTWGEIDAALTAYRKATGSDQ